jgi:hypothetical protein
MNRNFTQAECGLQGYFANGVQLGQFYSHILSGIDKTSRLRSSKPYFNDQTVKVAQT